MSFKPFQSKSEKMLFNIIAVVLFPGTSNWSGDYFVSTAGSALVVNQTASQSTEPTVQSQLQPCSRGTGAPPTARRSPNTQTSRSSVSFHSHQFKPRSVTTVPRFNVYRAGVAHVCLQILKLKKPWAETSAADQPSAKFSPCAWSKERE